MMSASPMRTMLPSSCLRFTSTNALRMDLASFPQLAPMAALRTCWRYPNTRPNRACQERTQINDLGCCASDAPPDLESSPSEGSLHGTWSSELQPASPTKTQATAPFGIPEARLQRSAHSHSGTGVCRPMLFD